MQMEAVVLVARVAQTHDEELARRWLRTRKHIVIHDDATSTEWHPYAEKTDDELDEILCFEPPPWW